MLNACTYSADDLALIEKLIELGLDVYAVNDNGNTALHYAALSANVKIICLLVSKYKLDVNAANIRGDRPIHSLAKGINLIKVTENQMLDDEAKAEIYLKLKPYLESIQALNRFGADLRVRDYDGNHFVQIINESFHFVKAIAEVIPNVLRFDVDRETGEFQVELLKEEEEEEERRTN